MNDQNNTNSYRPEENLNDTINKISELQDMPLDVVKKLIEAQGSLKDSEFAKKIDESKNNS
ncbi:MAG: hypothetical protein ROY99_14875 [Ignavibacterium sp.]|mgnify:CR=1 FL=1|jgi:hypothetical protein|nr:hypothetical protein [Ignavibacterium sp.]